MVPEGWVECPLGDAATIYSGGTPSRQNPSFYGGSVPWVKSGEVNQPVIVETDETITNEAVTGSSAKWVEPETTLVAMYGATAGKVSRLAIRATINQAISAIVPKPEMATNRYIYYAMQMGAPELLKSVQGSGQPNLSGQLLKKAKVALPPLPEQRAIAAILTAVDDAIQATQAVIDQTRVVMNELILAAVLGLDSPRYLPLEEISTAMNNGFVGKVNEHYTDNGGVPYVLGKHVRANSLEHDGTTQVSRSFHEGSERTQLRAGNMLTVQSGHVGTSCIVPDEFDGTNCHAVIITRLDTSIVFPQFISYYMNSQHGFSRLQEIFVGSTVPHINTKHLRKFTVPVPPLNEQQQIAAMATSIQESRLAELRKLAALQITKQGLLHDLLTGTIRVPGAAA